MPELELFVNSMLYQDEGVLKGLYHADAYLRLLNLSRQASERSSAVEKKVDEGMLSWFYSALTCEVKEGSADMGEMGGDQIYLSEYINNYDVLENIRRWNKEGCTFFVNLKELAQYSEDLKIVAMSQDDLKNAIKDQITKENGESSFSQVEQDAMLFLLLGESGGTEYSSILDIDEELFLDSVLNLDEVIGRAINFSRESEIEVDLRKKWLNLF